jgi:hypothetical protein
LLELDMETWEAEHPLVLPSMFVPDFRDGRLRYPMWRFCTWLKDKFHADSWKDLANVLGWKDETQAQTQDCEQQIRNWANTKTLTKVPSWGSFREMLDNAGVTESGRLEIQFAFGVTRILQLHASRTLPLALEYLFDPEDAGEYYLARIEDLKKNECGVIPRTHC